MIFVIFLSSSLMYSFFFKYLATSFSLMTSFSLLVSMLICSALNMDCAVLLLWVDLSRSSSRLMFVSGGYIFLSVFLSWIL